VPPRASSRIVVAVVMDVPEALATAIPAPVSTTAADTAAAMAPGFLMAASQEITQPPTPISQ